MKKNLVEKYLGEGKKSGYNDPWGTRDDLIERVKNLAYNMEFDIWEDSYFSGTQHTKQIDGRLKKLEKAVAKAEMEIKKAIK